MNLFNSHLSWYDPATIISKANTPLFLPSTVVGNLDVHMVEQVVCTHMTSCHIDYWRAGVL